MRYIACTCNSQRLLHILVNELIEKERCGETLGSLDMNYTSNLLSSNRRLSKWPATRLSNHVNISCVKQIALGWKSMESCPLLNRMCIMKIIKMLTTRFYINITYIRHVQIFFNVYKEILFHFRPLNVIIYLYTREGMLLIRTCIRFWVLN